MGGEHRCGRSFEQPACPPDKPRVFVSHIYTKLWHEEHAYNSKGYFCVRGDVVQEDEGQRRERNRSGRL